VLIHPIIDEFYNHKPTAMRSPGLAVAAGQTTGDGMAEKSTKAAFGMAGSANGVGIAAA